MTVGAGAHEEVQSPLHLCRSELWLTGLVVSRLYYKASVIVMDFGRSVKELFLFFRPKVLSG